MVPEITRIVIETSPVQQLQENTQKIQQVLPITQISAKKWGRYQQFRKPLEMILGLIVWDKN